MYESNVKAFLEILRMVHFDEALFRKEFGKTLNWIPKSEHDQVYNWMTYNHFEDRFPDLMKMLAR